MSSARMAILDRIVAANGSASSLEFAEQDWDRLPRAYAVTTQRTASNVLNLLQERLLDYEAVVLRCAPAQIPATLNAALVAARVQRIGIPPGLEAGLLPEGFDFMLDDTLPTLELDRLDAVLTRCTLAIAETGTLVLQNTAAQGRRALTLVPDVHLCLVRSSDVVETVPQAFARLQPTVTLPTTFVSGPSATADIEMTRVKGVHGPRFLYVVLVEDSPLAA
jgi:L-lactate dehydrogenase complex protein LldG